MKQTILITGSRSGIGRDTAMALARRGHRVIATVHRQESVVKLFTYAKKQKVKLEVFKLDITDLSDRSRLKDYEIDVLINNAAIGESGSLSEIPMHLVRDNFETNLFSTLELTQVVLDAMIKRNSGKVIFISSIAGRIPMPWWGSYSMTKYSLSAAADILRQEMTTISKNIYISVIEPGTYHTGFNQKVIASKFKWLDKTSYFRECQAKLNAREERMFKILERHSTDSIVKQIIKAVESSRPRLRYTAPWWQAIFVKILRVFGR